MWVVFSRKCPNSICAIIANFYTKIICYALLDEAYMKIKSGGRGVRKQKQDYGITAYTVDMRRKIGFVGGQTGKRRNNPSTNHVRLVLQGDRVITAYPFKP